MVRLTAKEQTFFSEFVNLDSHSRWQEKRTMMIQWFARFHPTAFRSIASTKPKDESEFAKNARDLQPKLAKEFDRKVKFLLWVRGQIEGDRKKP